MKHTCRAVYCRRLARKMGAGYIVIPDYPDWLDRIHSLTGRLQGADHVIEASGMSEADAAFEAALSKKAREMFLYPQGKLPAVGYFA